MTCFLEGVYENIDLKSVRLELEKIPGDQSVQQLRIWSIDGEENAMNVHLYAKRDGFEDARTIEQLVREATAELNIGFSTIEMEGVNE